MKKTVGVVIGRFQSGKPHAGHMHLLGVAASQVDRLLVLVGSANQCRSIKNPWTYSERVQALIVAMRNSKIDLSRVEFAPLNDYRYSDGQWLTDVRMTIGSLAKPDEKVILFGHYKIGNDYLNWFPEFEFRSVESSHAIDATTIRNKLFAERDRSVPETVLGDYLFYEREKVAFAKYPYPDTLNFNCGDAILECNGHILLIERKFAPGAGTMALPGGFKNRDETFLDCAIRELNEETNVRVPEKVLRGSIVGTRLFDDPTRCMGIPRSTLAVHIRIQPDKDGSLPRANGRDDAASCRWVPLSEALNSIAMFDDHKDIISVMTGVVQEPAYKSQVC